MDLLLLTARVLLAMVFALAGFGKLSDLAGARKSMLDFGAPRAMAPLLSFLLPLAELACAVALIPASSAWWGAAGVLALLLLFIAAIAFNMARGRRPDCHCFGQLHSAPVGWTTLARNATLCAISGFVLWQGPDHPGASPGAWLSSLTRLESIVLAVGCAGSALAGFALYLLFQLLRKYGRLLVRMEAVEARLGIGLNSTAPPPGLPVDTPAPSFSLPALDGGTAALDVLNAEGIPVLLIFTEPGCGACETLLPDIVQWQGEHAGRLKILLISRGTEAENRANSDKYGLRDTLLQQDREVSEAYRIAATPAAVLLVDGRIASEPALGPDAIRGLVARQVLPRVARGEAVPTLRLPDLDGATVDLAALRGQRSLLLFWNPSCGYCQNMLPDLKKWEQTPLNAAPRLVVLSTGSVEDNRRQGLRASILLDPGSSAMYVFGAGGTPSAVMLDAAGRVASDVGVGADAVLALAGVVRVAAG